MPTVLLAVSSNYSASSVVAQGSMDATPGYDVGSALPCPGTFPATIKAKCRIAGTGAGLVEAVFAGPNHVVIRELIHNYVPSRSNVVRLETINRSVKVVGGTYTDLLSTLQPVLSPYGGVPSVSIGGLPTELWQGVFSSSTTIANSSSAADAGNFYFAVDGFTFSFSNKSSLGESWHALFSSDLGANRPVSINMDAYAGFALSGTGLLPYYPVQCKKGPVLINGTDFNDGDIFYGAGGNTPASRRPASIFLASENAPVFGCFNSSTGQLNSNVFGTQPGANIEAMAVYNVNRYQGNYVFAGIRKNNFTPYLGHFSDSSLSADQLTTEFFEFYRSSYACAGLKPYFGIDTALRSVNTATGNSIVNLFWDSALPKGRRYGIYSDVQTTQYGFVFLNKATKHLEFMFQPHLEPWFVSPKLQTINKLVHAPPRSADYYPALNMLLGVNPKDPINGTSLYQQNDAVIRNFFTADQITHGGGGHVMAMGTFNGAIVHNGQVTVWGSNRWGQCVQPSILLDLANLGGKIVDVAVANSPPVFAPSGYANNSVYSDDRGEYYARSNYDAGDFSYDATTQTRTKFYSYPPGPFERYGQHINFTNLPGHIVVVTDSGWVYAWGNDKYYQCQVPEEISLVDSTGAIKTGVPVDPISEVSAGAFHTVARSRAGIVYVWGAGGPWAGALGRVVGTLPSDIIPNDGGNPAVNSTVHFGQSCLNANNTSSTTLLGIQAPQANPLTGLTSATAETYSITLSSYTTITDLVKTINGTNVSIGQKTNTAFSVADPGTPAGSAGRLKGMIGAGAFHTAIIDNQLKIQCIGAGRGYMDGSSASTTTDVSSVIRETDSLGGPIWGSSHSSTSTEFSTYPHYCQSIDQYRAPIAIIGTTPQGVGLFRRGLDSSQLHKSRYFQNLQFKKVVCGPFTTHGIIHSVDRSNQTTNPYTAIDRAYLHNRVVSWGRAFGFRVDRFNQQQTGPTGLRTTFGNGGDLLGVVSNTDRTRNATASYNISGTIAGMGALNAAGLINTPRYFEIINRAVGSSGGIYTSTNTYLTLVAANPGPDSAASGISVGTVTSTDSTTSGPLYNSHCPVTISRFKVKDLASCGDFTVFIGFVDRLSQSSSKWHASDTATSGATLSGTTFDYQSSVFFTGPDYYNTAAVSGPYDLPGRLHATNPYAGVNLVRRNKVGQPYVHNGNTGRAVKDRSLYFGLVKQNATGVQGALPGGTAQTIQYVVPTTALASCNLVTTIVNMDNRPVAWNGFFQMNSYEYETPIDLSLLPSIPIENFKAGKSHIMAVTAGDWPVAISLGSASTTPKLVSELGSRLFSGTVPSVSVAPNLIYGEPDVYKRPVLIAWGAGDGREYGGTLLSFSSGGSSMGSTFGIQFLDTHAITRYDATYGGVVGATQPLSTGSDNWENYYGEYRWNLYSTYSDSYNDPFIEIGSTGTSMGSQYGGPQQPTDVAISLRAGHHAVEAMQSLLAFRLDKYPTTFANPSLGGRNLLNGSSVAAIPSAAYMPFVRYASYPVGADLKKVMCCSTAADEAGSNYASINSLQEFHSPLGYMQQSYTDYVVDYAAGSKHSAVLFSSACPDYTKVSDGTYKANLTNFASFFMADAAGAIPFGSRRVRKLGIVGYGCENQTAGVERQLGDGSFAPIVPMLFGSDAKVYCGDSYTLVTNPVKIHTLTSSATAMNLTAGASASSLTIPINVASNLFSNRIRGLDVLLTFTATAASSPLPLTNLTISIPYKNNTWVVFDQIRANLDTTPATAYVPAGTSTTTYRVSSRFWASGYTYSNSASGENYNELGLAPTVASSYTNVSSQDFLKGLDAGAAIPALSQQGCYYPASVGLTGTSLSRPTWSMTTTNNVVLPFNEPTINVVISDATNTTSYANYTLTVKLEVEVDAGDVPYVIFGPNRSGVYNELEGYGPSYVADIGIFGNDFARPNIDILNCPCEIDSTLQDRKYPKSFPADSRFFCGTRKYGPSGNRENQAAYSTETYYYQDGSSRPPLLGGSQITANFFNLFDTLPHRASTNMPDALLRQAPVLQVLPPAASISSGTIKNLVGGLSFKLNAVLPLTLAASPSLTTTVTNPVLSFNRPIMYNGWKTEAVSCKANTITANNALRLNIGLQSGNC